MPADGAYEDPGPLMDSMTGLPNREGFRQLLAEEYERAKRLQLPLSLLALDLDHFREINRTYFLPAGDQVFAEVARRVARAARPGDVVVRDGGDQFSVILPGTAGDQARREAERIRLAVASAPVRLTKGYNSAEVPVTVSIGVVTATFEEADAWELFTRARDAVHRAKDAGRNRVEVA
jgi:diguanylate cyclase (GGDEF)-like protein